MKRFRPYLLLSQVKCHHPHAMASNENGFIQEANSTAKYFLLSARETANNYAFLWIYTEVQKLQHSKVLLRRIT
ncbi:hypothetical protein Glove_519g33 [Diversispora epigaea]|uniref:Uncharacterized protein n=1 Tax=Diversispora epigaea TaxID=1348612 RepID=A0A397GNN7_9GLOM|nr:hypothetical protein Glove_519g33 [Diversispora epigaea]